MPMTDTTGGNAALLNHVLRHGDRALVLAQRLGEWVAGSPELEEDMALANISLDLLGQARVLYTYAAELEGLGHDEDHFAYWRGPDEFRNPLIVEQPNGDFANTIARQFLHDAYAVAHWDALRLSSDETLAALAARAIKETSFHLRHSRGWLVRLGDGTDESHRRMQAGLDAMWPFAAELAALADESELRECGVVPDAGVRAAFETVVASAIDEATLTPPAPVEVATSGSGWDGTHSQHLVDLLDELQVLARAHRGASW
jgi:ring-1,2-phenylacetyl-CoA epoxidase subunit PaaC